MTSDVIAILLATISFTHQMYDVIDPTRSNPRGVKVQLTFADVADLTL